jgi:hypothetical protein
MKIGTLVRDILGAGSDDLHIRRGVGIIVGFDKDGDPVVWFTRPLEYDTKQIQACYRSEIEILKK